VHIISSKESWDEKISEANKAGKMVSICFMISKNEYMSCLGLLNFWTSYLMFRSNSVNISVDHLEGGEYVICINNAKQCEIKNYYAN